MLPDYKFSGLRKRAEDFLDTVPEDPAKTPSSEESRKLIQELHIYQTELEMQNEELRRTQQELEAQRDKYSDLYDFAPVGYFTISDKGTVLEANLTGASMLGVERQNLKGEPFPKFITKDMADSFYLAINSLIKNQFSHQTFELVYVQISFPPILY